MPDQLVARGACRQGRLPPLYQGRGRRAPHTCVRRAGPAPPLNLVPSSPGRQGQCIGSATAVAPIACAGLWRGTTRPRAPWGRSDGSSRGSDPVTLRARWNARTDLVHGSRRVCPRCAGAGGGGGRGACYCAPCKQRKQRYEYLHVPVDLDLPTLHVKPAAHARSYLPTPCA